MAREHRSELEVRAPAEAAWAVLADFEAYGEWSPFLRRLRGPRTVGAALFVNARPPRARGMLFRPRLVTWEPPRELAFRGQLVAPGLFDGLYRFVVDPIDPERCRISASLAFSGRLVPLLVWKTGSHMGEAIAGHAEAWRHRAESLASLTPRAAPRP